MKSPIRILIVDDHSMVRLALSQAIGRNADLLLVGEAENGAKAVALYRNLRPDVVVMDYKLPDRDGDKVTAEIRAEFPEAQVVLLSIFENPENVWRATEAGTLGYVSKAAEISEVLSAIRRVAGGKPYYSAGIAEKLAQRDRREKLSPRELAVLELIVAGRSNKEIVSDLQISISTVKHYVESIFTKLGVQDRTQAAVTAVQFGLVRLDE
jgi:two-component system NarL family response regulator